MEIGTRPTGGRGAEGGGEVAALAARFLDALRSAPGFCVAAAAEAAGAALARELREGPARGGFAIESLSEHAGGEGGGREGLAPWICLAFDLPPYDPAPAAARLSRALGAEAPGGRRGVLVIERAERFSPAQFDELAALSGGGARFSTVLIGADAETRLASLDGLGPLRARGSLADPAEPERAPPPRPAGPADAFASIARIAAGPAAAAPERRADPPADPSPAEPPPDGSPRPDVVPLRKAAAPPAEPPDPFPAPFASRAAPRPEPTGPPAERPEDPDDGLRIPPPPAALRARPQADVAPPVPRRSLRAEKLRAGTARAASTGIGSGRAGRGAGWPMGWAAGWTAACLLALGAYLIFPGRVAPPRDASPPVSAPAPGDAAGPEASPPPVPSAQPDEARPEADRGSEASATPGAAPAAPAAPETSAAPPAAGPDPAAPPAGEPTAEVAPDLPPAPRVTVVHGPTGRARAEAAIARLRAAGFADAALWASESPPAEAVVRYFRPEDEETARLVAAAVAARGGAAPAIRAVEPGPVAPETGLIELVIGE